MTRIPAFNLVLAITATLTAFAANSLLCRMALGDDLIDPIAFTAIRLASGAAVLLMIARFSRAAAGVSHDGRGSWASGLCLFAYAMAFSLAYVSLSTGMGALILFGAVQTTMIGYGLFSGDRPGLLQWFGILAALAGLVWLVLPGLAAPDPVGAVLMAVAGVAWGGYSIRGRASTAPVMATMGNFVRTVPMAALASIIALSSLQAQPRGIVLAVISGGITSGLGYVLWYRVLRDLSSTRAAVLQLLVPVLAAMAGVTLLGESVSSRLLVASALILGGVAVAVVTPALVDERSP